VSRVSSPVTAQTMEAPRDSPRALPARRIFAAYCLVIALVPVMAVIGSFFIARSSWYLRHQRNSYLTISDYPFTMRSAHCDVLIYGDSSALTGISPPVIASVTGLRTCNISQPNTALAVVGTFALDAFLRNNPRPQFLVLQFTAPDFTRPTSKGRLYEEGALQLVRQKLDLVTLKLFARHPLEALQFSEFILQTALLERDWGGASSERAWTNIRASQGLFTAPGAPLRGCVGDIERKEPDAAWIGELRNKYQTGGTRVLIYVAPYPACDPSYEYYVERLASLADNRLERYDITMFNEQNHFTLEGARRNSQRIAGDIVRGAAAAAAKNDKSAP
jgi:hypothetical protein